jgi:dihydroorotate dehydrogenase (fumarate)
LSNHSKYKDSERETNNMPLPPINPPLLNSANPWCTSLQHLTCLYACPHTGAVTTRTSLLQAFPHDDTIHQHAFFCPQSHAAVRETHDTLSGTEYPASLNTLGYSPFPLSAYLQWIEQIVTNASAPAPHTRKPFIVSVTGSPDQVAECYTLVLGLATRLPTTPLAVEVNLSCPNIANLPPPAYSSTSLKAYLSALATVVSAAVPLGLKTPPYTYAAQFDMLVDALREVEQTSKRDGGGVVVDFITAINTLGSCLVLADRGKEGDDNPLLASATGTGIGGLAGQSLHPLALGNVATLRRMLDRVPELAHVDIIGVGGVGDAEGFARMRAVGARVVAVGTALGRKGIPVFEKILQLKTSKL